MDQRQLTSLEKALKYTGSRNCRLRKGCLDSGKLIAVTDSNTFMFWNAKMMGQTEEKYVPAWFDREPGADAVLEDLSRLYLELTDNTHISRTGMHYAVKLASFVYFSDVIDSPLDLLIYTLHLDQTTQGPENRPYIACARMIANGQTAPLKEWVRRAELRLDAKYPLPPEEDDTIYDRLNFSTFLKKFRKFLNSPPDRHRERGERER